MNHFGTGKYSMHDADGNKYILTVDYDDNPVSPREWDNIAKIWCWHDRYIIGDSIPNRMCVSDALAYLCREYGVEYDEYTDTNDDLLTKLENCGKIVVQPIYAYEHSGITISTGCFSDSFDSGMIGFAFVDMKDVTSVDRAHEIICAEVEELDNYLTGSVYSMALEKVDTKHVETRCPDCGCLIEEFDETEYNFVVETEYGFYGDCLEENGIVDEIPLGIEFD